MLDFMDKVDTRNLNEFNRVFNTVRAVRGTTGYGLPYLGEQLSVRRMAYGHSIEQVLSPTEDLQTPLWLPTAFVAFVNEVVGSALQDLGLPPSEPLIVAGTRKWPDAQRRSDHAFGLQLVYWRVSIVTMWEEIDPRIDEIFATLRIFRGAQRELQSFGNLVDYDRLTRELSARARPKTGTELENFCDWVASPHQYGGRCDFNLMTTRPAYPRVYPRRADGPYS